MSGSGLEALMDVREWSGGPHGCPGVVGRPSQMSGNSRESLQEVWEALQMSLSGGSLFRTSGYCWEALPVVRELSGDPPRCP